MMTFAMAHPYITLFIVWSIGFTIREVIRAAFGRKTQIDYNMGNKEDKDET